MESKPNRKFKRQLYTVDQLKGLEGKPLQIIINYYEAKRPMHWIIRTVNAVLPGDKTLDLFDLYMVLVQLRRKKQVLNKREEHTNEMSIKQFIRLASAWKDGGKNDECIEKAFEVDKGHGSRNQALIVLRQINNKARHFRDKNGNIIKGKAAQAFMELATYFKVYRVNDNDKSNTTIGIDLRYVPMQILKDVADSCPPLREVLTEVMANRKEEKQERDEFDEVLNDSIVKPDHIKRKHQIDDEPVVEEFQEELELDIIDKRIVFEEEEPDAEEKQKKIQEQQKVPISERLGKGIF